MNAGLPKQFILLSGKPVLFYSLLAFHNNDPATKLIIVLAKEEIARWNQLCLDFKINIPHEIAAGGDSRTESVRSGLLLTGEGIIAIHDGARPLVSNEVIENCFLSAINSGSGIASVKPKDSLRVILRNTNKAVDREDYCLMQTPQTFLSEKIKKAFEMPGNQNSTDDATIFEKAGFEVVLVKGDYRNIKITTPGDLAIAEALLKS